MNIATEILENHEGKNLCNKGYEDFACRRLQFLRRNVNVSYLKISRRSVIHLHTSVWYTII